MATGATVGVVGMQALRRDINRLTADQQGPLYAAIKAAGKEAAEPVAQRARSTVPISDRARADAPGELGGSIRTHGTRTGATVTMGGSAVPYAGWIEFGGTRQAPHESSREFVKTGRYLFPAAADLASTTAALYSAAIERTLALPSVYTNVTTNPGSIHD